MNARILLPVALFLSAPLSAQGGSISWETDFDAALARAKAENRLLFVAFNMDGERANDEAVALHYRDPAIVALSKNTVNLFGSIGNHGKKCARVAGLTCEQHQRIEMRAREYLLKIPEGEPVIAPQHLFATPDGKVLLSCVYQITVGELEWLFAEALKKHDPEFKYELKGRSRAPQRAVFGYERPPEPAETPPTSEEVAQAIKDLRSGRAGFREWRDKLPIIARSPDKEAIQFASGVLGSPWVRGERLAMLLQMIGRISPPEWHEAVSPFLGDQDSKVRLAAAMALMKLRSSKPVKEITAQLKKETDPSVKGRLLRALAACRPGEAATSALILKTLKADASEEVRLHAALAAATLEDRKSVTLCLAAALADAAPKVRSAAAFAIASRRDKELLQHLEAVLARESNPDVRKWMEAAREAVGGGPMTPFKDFLATEAGDPPDRPMGEMPGGEGPGEGPPGGGPGGERPPGRGPRR